MLSKRQNFGACVSAQYVYVAGGTVTQDQQSASVLCERLDVRSQKWEKVPDCLYPSSGASLCDVNGFIFKVGGMSNYLTPQNGIEFFDPAANLWNNFEYVNKDKRVKLPSQANCVQITETQILIFGGQIYDVKSQDSYILNVTTKVLERIAPMPWPGCIIGSGILSQKLYALIGVNDNGKSLFAYYDGQLWLPLLPGTSR